MQEHRIYEKIYEMSIFFIYISKNNCLILVNLLFSIEINVNDSSKTVKKILYSDS